MLTAALRERGAPLSSLQSPEPGFFGLALSKPMPIVAFGAISVSPTIPE
jgi:hypothetical protein